MRVKGGRATVVQKISSSVTTPKFVHIVQVGRKQWPCTEEICFIMDKFDEATKQ